MKINLVKTGAEIAFWCIENCYSKDLLANELGVTRQTLFNWSRNKETIPRVVALALRALELEVDLRQVDTGMRVRKKSKVR